MQLAVLEDVLGAVEAGGAGANDGDAKRVVKRSYLSHFLCPYLSVWILAGVARGQAGRGKA